MREDIEGLERAAIAWAESEGWPWDSLPESAQRAYQSKATFVVNEYLAVSDALTTPEEIARLFHETYERLAPSVGYKTREASAVPWDEVPETNRQLMVAVAGEVLKVIAPATLVETEAEWALTYGDEKPKGRPPRTWANVRRQYDYAVDKAPTLQPRMWRRTVTRSGWREVRTISGKEVTDDV